MPLIDLAAEKWRRWRAKVARSEESRKKVFKQLHDAARHNDCQKIAYLLWEADGKPEGNGKRYYLEAQRRLKGFRWRLYQLHQPFIRLEKKIIEPLDSWADRANIFQFFSKISPILEALGVLAIPFVILYFEARQEQRQQQFEERVISAQADVRRAYLKGADLVGAYLEGAYLKGADLGRANIFGADLRRANYTDKNTPNTVCKRLFLSYPCPTIFSDNFDPKSRNMILIHTLEQLDKLGY